jgi:hypothetical protein
MKRAPRYILLLWLPLVVLCLLWAGWYLQAIFATENQSYGLSLQAMMLLALTGYIGVPYFFISLLTTLFYLRRRAKKISDGK